MLIPLYVLLLGREEEKKTRGVLLVSLLKTALSRLDVGPAYYEDPVSSNLYKGHQSPVGAISFYFGLFSWCAGAHFRFPFTSRGSRGSYAAAFPGPFLLVLRPEAIASS